MCYSCEMGFVMNWGAFVIGALIVGIVLIIILLFRK